MIPKYHCIKYINIGDWRHLWTGRCNKFLIWEHFCIIFLNQIQTEMCVQKHTLNYVAWIKVARNSPFNGLPCDLFYLWTLLAHNTLHFVMKPFVCGFRPSTRLSEGRGHVLLICVLSTELYTWQMLKNIAPWIALHGMAAAPGLVPQAPKSQHGGQEVTYESHGLVLPVPLSAYQWSGQTVVFSAGLGGLTGSPKHYRQLDTRI